MIHHRSPPASDSTASEWSSDDSNIQARLYRVIDFNLPERIGELIECEVICFSLMTSSNFCSNSTYSIRGAVTILSVKNISLTKTSYFAGGRYFRLSLMAAVTSIIYVFYRSSNLIFEGQNFCSNSNVII